MMDKIIGAIVDSWSPDTACPGTGVAEPGLPYGQCAVTALVVQDLLGGELLRAVLLPGSHYWNLVPGVGEVDLTREQYPRDRPIPRGVEVERSYVLDSERALTARTRERYELLAARVAQRLRDEALAA